MRTRIPEAMITTATSKVGFEEMLMVSSVLLVETAGLNEEINDIRGSNYDCTVDILALHTCSTIYICI